MHHSRQSPRASTATTARLSSFDPSSSRDHRARARVSSFPRHRRLVSTHRRGVTRQPSPGITHLALRWRSLASIALGATRSVAESPPPPPRAMDALERRRVDAAHRDDGAHRAREGEGERNANETRRRDDATTRDTRDGRRTRDDTPSWRRNSAAAAVAPVEARTPPEARRRRNLNTP